MLAAVNQQNAFGVYPLSSQAQQPRFDVVRQGRGRDVEAQFNGRRDFVDILPAVTRRTDELFLELALVDRNRRGHLYRRHPSLVVRRRLIEF